MWNRLIPLARSPIGDSMADPRIIDVQLDERTILWRSADVEQERRIAIYDLLEGNHFAPRRPHDDGYAGPYLLPLAVEEGSLALSTAREDRRQLDTHARKSGREGKREGGRVDIGGRQISKKKIK